MRSPAKVWLAASIALVVAAVLLQWYGHYGDLLGTPDSCNYISAAESFRTTHRFISFDGERFMYWPPLFPIVLSVFGKVWYWIQLLLTAWIGVLIVIETGKAIEDPMLRFVCQCSILLGVHLLLISVFLWSELLFLLILLHFIKALEKNFVAAILLGFLLCLQRHAGLFFVLGAAIWLWDAKRSIILFALSSSGLLIWNIYNPAVLEYEYFQSILHNLGVMSDALMYSIAPLPGALLVVVAGTLVYFLRFDTGTRLISIMLITYIVCMTLIFRIDPSDTDRFVAVVIPLFMILVFRALEIAVSEKTSLARNLLMIVVICWLAYPLSRTLKNAVQWHNVSFTSYFCAIQF